MPTQLTTAQHLAGLSEAMRAFVRYADRAGLEAPVPTCPDWTVLDLVAHQGMVHRWAAALLRGERPTDEEVAAYEASAATPTDPLVWLGEGAAALAEAVTGARGPRGAGLPQRRAAGRAAFWARRQCHETTMHAVDALAASLGPAAATRRGLDRPRAGRRRDRRAARRLPDPAAVPVRCDDDALLVVCPDDLRTGGRSRWGPGPRPPRRHPGGDVPADDADWELTGTAVELYLRLWNRTTRRRSGAG